MTMGLEYKSEIMLDLVPNPELRKLALHLKKRPGRKSGVKA